MSFICGHPNDIAFILTIALLGIPFYGHGASSILIGILVIGVLAIYLAPQMQEKMFKIEDCLHCGKCMSHCPYELNTPELLQKNLQDYKEILAGKEY